MLIGLNALQQRQAPNKVERAGYALLDRLGVPYERQYLIADKFCVDAYIPSARLVVQFDGDYWHGNPALYPTLDARQRKRMQLDRSQDAYMASCTYRVVRFWASTLAAEPEGVVATLRAFLTGAKEAPPSAG